MKCFQAACLGYRPGWAEPSGRALLGVDETTSVLLILGLAVGTPGAKKALSTLPPYPLNAASWPVTRSVN